MRGREARLMEPSRLLAVAAVMFAAVTAGRAAEPIPRPGTDPEIERLAVEARDLNFAGRWSDAERVASRLAARDPSEPLAPLLVGATVFWRAGVDPGDRSLDAAIESAIARATELAEARLEENDDDAHAHFALGEARSFASRLAIERGELLTAGYEGERSRKLLERALELAPDLEDARVPLGAYLYFADLVPAALDWLSWLPFVPSGDRQRGLALLARATSTAKLNRLAARSVLFRIDSRYESGRTAEAAELGAALYREFPGNPVLALDWLRFLAETGQAPRARETAGEVLAKVAAHAEGFDVRVAREARTWLARTEMRDAHFDLANELVEEAHRTDPSRSRRAMAWEWLTRGQLADRQGRRDEATSFYRRVDALEGEEADPEARRLARRYLESADVASDPGPLVARSSESGAGGSRSVAREP